MKQYNSNGTVDNEQEVEIKMSYYNKAEAEIVVDVAVDAERISLTAKDERDIDPMGTGFVWYTPPLANSVTANLSEKKHDNCEWNIAGHDMQILTMTVAPNERIVTEVGSFMFGSSGIDMNTELTCCTSAATASEGGNGGCSEGCQRICGGESCVKLLLVNKGPNPGVRGRCTSCSIAFVQRHLLRTYFVYISLSTSV